MIYKFTSKGEKMFPGSELTTSYKELFSGLLSLKTFTPDGKTLYIANGPRDIEALIRLELIEEI